MSEQKELIVVLRSLVVSIKIARLPDVCSLVCVATGIHQTLNKVDQKDANVKLLTRIYTCISKALLQANKCNLTK